MDNHQLQSLTSTMNFFEEKELIMHVFEEP